MPSKTQSILLGGGVVGLLVGILSIATTSMQGSPIGSVVGCVACLTYIGAGLIAVWHYTNTYDLTIPAGQGVGMGALAGVVAAIVGILIGLLLRAIGLVPSPEEMMQAMERSGQFDEMSEDQIEMTRNMMGWFMGPVGYAIGVVVGALLGLIGGGIGAALFKKGGDTAPETL